MNVIDHVSLGEMGAGNNNYTTSTINYKVADDVSANNSREYFVNHENSSHEAFY